MLSTSLWLLASVFACLQDWCVSRQLWWGHRIPVWYVHSSQADADSAEEGRSDRWVAWLRCRQRCTAALGSVYCLVML
jgi:valyl-tRNA synthetase